jgi:hypothetical protein
LEKELKTINSKKGESINTEDEQDDTCEGVDLDSVILDLPQYLKAKLLMDAAELGGSTSPNVIGWKLLERRANVEMQSMSCSDILKLRNQLVDDWAKASVAVADAAEARKVVLQIAEEMSTEESSIKINPSVAEAAGVLYDERYSPPVKTPNKRFFNSSPRHSCNTPSKKNLSANKPPLITPGTSDSEIKRRTGFSSEAAMLSYIMVVCGGEISLIRKRQSSLTWYEEWVFHLEWKYGKTIHRWIDASIGFCL